MRNIKLVISYDGTNFKGYQYQHKNRTVQNELEKALFSVMKEKIRINAAGRTDTGVHAINQVVNFNTTNNLPIEVITRLVNGRLNKIGVSDIYIKAAEEVDISFNSRYSAMNRTYIYIMTPIRYYNVFDRNYVCYIKDHIDIDKFLKIVEPLKGSHDFSSFSIKSSSKSSFIRNIEDINLIYNDNKYILYITANGFLRGMVRIIVGSTLAIYFKKRPLNYLVDKINIPRLNSEKLSAKPQGLYFYNVKY